VEICDSAEASAEQAHALLVLTEWDEFRDVDFKAVHARMMKPAWLFDGRNVLDHDALRQTGFRVRAIGKDPAASTSSCSWTA
jgi:UDPglucose 6-dehydrogenase